MWRLRCVGQGLSRSVACPIISPAVSRAIAGQRALLSSVSSPVSNTSKADALPQRTIRRMLEHIKQIGAAMGQGTSNTQQTITVQGWLRSARIQSHVAFLVLNDGSCLEGIQLVVPDPTILPAEGLATGSSGSSFCKGRLWNEPWPRLVTGNVAPRQGHPGQFELHVSEVVITGGVGEGYPMHKARLPLEKLREILHLRPRSNVIGAAMRLRNAAHTALHSFLQSQDFILVHTPILTPLDCEGAGDLFHITPNTPQSQTSNSSADPSSSFFGAKAFLNVSGQLYAEMAASAFSRVYAFGPTFRAEHSHSSRHLAEFWMIEPEIAFATLEDVLRLAQDLVQFTCASVREQIPEDMSFFDKRIQPGLLKSLDELCAKPFAVLTYTEAIDILQRSGKKFTYPVEWGLSLQAEHEQYLASQGAVFVTHYPRKIKAFYMRADQPGPLESSVDSRQTCACFDLLVPTVGELAGGSQREEREDQLSIQLQEHQLDPLQYEWYLQLRRFGTVPHAGFGIGFERLLRLLSGIQNVRDLALVPRYHGNLRF
eukprot:g56561.t1